MALKEFIYKGKTLRELKSLSLNEFIQILPARKRRSLKRGFTEQQKILLKKMEKNNNSKPIKTHVRDMIILPSMVGQKFLVYNGKEFKEVIVIEEMLGHCLGVFTYNRQRVKHSAPGIGATRSSAALSVK